MVVVCGGTPADGEVQWRARDSSGGQPGQVEQHVGAGGVGRGGAPVVEVKM